MLPNMKPRSAGSLSVNLLGLLVLYCATYYARAEGYSTVQGTLMVMLCYAAALALLEVFWLRTPFQPASGLSVARMRFNVQRSGLKLIGVTASWGFVAWLYWLFPEYHPNMLPNDERQGFYEPFGEMVLTVLPVVCVLAIPYVALTDALMESPEDSYYWLGRLLTLQWRGVPFALLRQHLLGWVVRGFFLALLCSYAEEKVRTVMWLDASAAIAQPGGFYAVFRDLALMACFVVAATGHAMTLRLLGTHIRSVEPTLFGWWVCLACFEPLRSVTVRYIQPEGQADAWVGALAHSPTLLGLWMLLLIAALGVFLLAESALGIRYSHLTHRGIVTHGVYRFCKHPSYVAQWCMAFLAFPPFFAWETTGQALAGLGAHVLMGVIYYLRARSEEVHLSGDPDYVQYALWMNDHGIFRFLARRIPALMYRDPRSAGVAYA